MTLDTTSLGNALQRLREGVARWRREATDEQIRDGLIQRFEFTYELSRKMHRRYLKETAASPDEIERMAFADLIRTGNAQGLLRGDWPAWRRFREMRAHTSHTYDDKVASQVASAIPGFLEEAEHLYAELQRVARMTRCLQIDLPADHRRLVLNILHANLSQSIKTWVSRLAGDRPGKALFRPRFGDRRWPAADAR
jgi:nucleotidyltransferase substrate binding protein (TIGR01987 family)